MDASIFFFVASNDLAKKNYKTSIEEGVELSKLLSFIDNKEIRQKLQANAIHGRVYLWGAVNKRTDQNQKVWQQMKEGDLVLGYADKRVVCMAYAVATLDNAAIGETIWNSGGNKPFNMLFFLTKPTICEVPMDTVSDYLGKNVQNFRRLADDRTKRIRQDYGSLKEFVRTVLLKGQQRPPGLNNAQYANFDYQQALGELIQNIGEEGFVFEPWLVAAYVTALRTKPFVMLAGVSGTGKSKLPKLVAEATGGTAELIPVRPDWTDSSDVIGYVNLQCEFCPGEFLQIVREADEHPLKHFVCIMDEMNLARVEHYFAEVLSCIEDRSAADSGGFESIPLGKGNHSSIPSKWSDLRIPPNLAIVGTVNMDESTYGFSRKVLDRAFTLEFSDIDLENWQSQQQENGTVFWPVSAWYSKAIRLSQLTTPTEEEKTLIEQVIETLTTVNQYLTQAQLQIGYRTRDEIALFVLEAQKVKEVFVTRDDKTVDPLDLALQMKILPRIAGGSNTIRQVVLQLLTWSYAGGVLKTGFDEKAEEIRKEWKGANCPAMLENALYPRTAARLCLMFERLQNEGFTSFWL